MIYELRFMIYEKIFNPPLFPLLSKEGMKGAVIRKSCIVNLKSKILNLF